jgi:hypothetical protein
VRSLLSRHRRSEDQRVDNFLHAIALSARYRVDPDWQLQAVPDDTTALPVALVQLMIPLPPVAGR